MNTVQRAWKGIRPPKRSAPDSGTAAAEKFGLSYSAKELAVLTACIKECGIDYTEVFKAAQSEAGRMAILSDANATCLGKIVQTTGTRNFIQRLREPVKSEVHVQQGCDVQELKDDQLVHQTVVQHTDPQVYDKRKGKTGADGKPKYRSADVCAIQLGVTSHLAATSGQIAGVMMLDGGRATTAEGVLGLGLIPLYKATSHALFFPRLNISYNDPDFLDRIQLVTVFSDGVKGGGRPAMSYSTMSVVRHNIVDAHFLPEALPSKLIEEKYPQGVQPLKDFQVTEVAPAEPARLTRSFSYMPLGRKSSQTVLNWEPDGTARVTQPLPVMARNAITFEGLTLGENSARRVLCADDGTCPIHNRTGCPCDQHNVEGYTVPSNPADDKSATNQLPTACIAYEPQEIPLIGGFQRVGCHPFTVAISANVGTVCLSLEIGEAMFKNTNVGKQLKLIPTMKMKVRFRLSGSASLQSSGCFYLCYDPNDTLARYPSRERALMLPGVYFMPGRYDSVDFQVDHLAVPQNFVLMDAHMAGHIKVVLIDELRNMEVTDYGMELEAFVEAEGTIPTGLSNGLVATDRLPLGQVVLDMPFDTKMTKGTCYTILLHPVYPAQDGAQLYPSCSSTVLEAHTFWDGILEIEVVFSLPALSGGLVDISLSQDSWNGFEKDRYTLHGATRVDLRSQRIIRLKCTMKSWNGFYTAGRGSIFGHSPLEAEERSPRLNIMFTSPPIITDAHKKGKFWVRYIAIDGLRVFGATITQKRTGDMAQAGAPLDMSVGAPREWKWNDPTAIVVRDYFEKPRQFRIASVTSWPKQGWLHIPCTPCCFFPRFEGNFRGEIEPLNYLAHRAQENAMWRGKLKYSVLVVRQSTKVATNSVSLVAYQNLGMAKMPSFTEKNQFVIAPVLGSRGAFVADDLTTVCEVETPGDRWFWTRHGKQDKYTRSFAPQWLSIKFPSDTNLELNIDNIDIFVEADIEFFHPIPPFPLTITTKLPDYYWKNNYPVD
ncbi:polyprotein [Cohombrillo associated virus]|uniref:Polyprotein n=1 Tax=Cohombrillo associated virus TaxID=3016143 RepID=A0A9F1U5E0_9VIRU|nr:polyprotein [Cohombrillo associated virus]